MRNKLICTAIKWKSLSLYKHYLNFQFSAAQQSHQIKSVVDIGQDEQDSEVERFKHSIMKDAKIYMDWTISASNEKTEHFLEKLRQKLETHFERNPGLDSTEFEKLTNATKAYAKDFFTAELIPPGELFDKKNTNWSDFSYVLVLREHYSYFKPERTYKLGVNNI